MRYFVGVAVTNIQFSGYVGNDTSTISISSWLGIWSHAINHYNTKEVFEVLVISKLGVKRMEVRIYKKGYKNWHEQKNMQLNSTHRLIF